jgi:hypothetical protein
MGNLRLSAQTLRTMRWECVVWLGDNCGFRLSRLDTESELVTKRRSGCEQSLNDISDEGIME